MVNLGRLRCLQPGCARERPLLVQPGGLLVCPSCRAALPPREYFRRYGRRTAQWIVAGAVWLSVGAGRDGALRIALLAAGVIFLGYALARVLWQALALRALARDRGPEAHE
jgi:hypothetical protein